MRKPNGIEDQLNWLSLMLLVLVILLISLFAVVFSKAQDQPPGEPYGSRQAVPLVAMKIDPSDVPLDRLAFRAAYREAQMHLTPRDYIDLLIVHVGPERGARWATRKSRAADTLPRSGLRSPTWNSSRNLWRCW